MNREQFIRTELLLGEQGMEQLYRSRVAVFGIGGVGGFAAEALARSGVGSLALFDHDTVALSNINRQIIATIKTVGQAKVEVMKERVLSINPEIQVTAYDTFYLPDNSHAYPLTEYDYIIDAVDTVTAKIELAVRAYEAGVPIISSMGAGNKLDPTGFAVADIYETSVCPLAKVMRKELKRRDIPALKVVYSREEPRKPLKTSAEEAEAQSKIRKRMTPGSIAFVPSVAGLIIAGEVIKDLTGLELRNKL